MKTEFFQHLALVSALLGAVPACAAPVCVDPERGIGGTGAAARSPSGSIGGTGAVAGAIGGTGTPQGSIGGTGAVAAGAIGGTGAAQGAIGGTGAVAGAIGGTGAVAGAIGGTGAKTNGGIGGTGHMAQGLGGTGIVGTITGFASVCVNGLEVHYDDATPVTANGAASAANQLAVGQMVAIEALPSTRGLTARRISVLHAVAGPVTEVQPGQGMIRVMGQTVRVGADTRIAGPSGGGGIGDIRPGDMVQVSGHRGGAGEIRATRVQEVATLTEHSVIGHVRGGGRQAFSIDDTKVEGTRVDLGEGTEALVRGRWSGDRISAEDIQANPTRSAIGGVERLVVEGLVRRDGTDTRVGEFTLVAAATGGLQTGQGKLKPDQRVRIVGRLDREGRVSVDRVELDRSGDSSTRRGSDGGRGSPQAGRLDEGSRGSADTRSDRGGGDRDVAARTEKNDRSNGGDRVERIDNSGRSDRSQRTERLERSERVDRTERVERVERVDRPEAVERVDRVDRPEPVQRPAPVERIERVEKPEKVEKPENTNSGKSQ